MKLLLSRRKSISIGSRKSDNAGTLPIRCLLLVYSKINTFVTVCLPVLKMAASAKESCNKAANHRRNERHVVTMTCGVRRAGSEPHGARVLGVVTCLRLKCSLVLPRHSRGWQCPFLRSAITDRELILIPWPITPFTSECHLVLLVYHNKRASSSPRSCLLQKLGMPGKANSGEDMLEPTVPQCQQHSV